MISRDNTVALSNMPVVSETPITSLDSPESLHKGFGQLLDIDKACGGGGWKVTSFEQTPLVSND